MLPRGPFQDNFAILMRKHCSKFKPSIPKTSTIAFFICLSFLKIYIAIHPSLSNIITLFKDLLHFTEALIMPLLLRYYSSFWEIIIYILLKQKNVQKVQVDVPNSFYFAVILKLTEIFKKNCFLIVIYFHLDSRSALGTAPGPRFSKQKKSKIMYSKT